MSGRGPTSEGFACRKRFESPIGFGPLSEYLSLSTARRVRLASGPVQNALFVESVFDSPIGFGPLSEYPRMSGACRVCLASGHCGMRCLSTTFVSDRPRALVGVSSFVEGLLGILGRGPISECVVCRERFKSPIGFGPLSECSCLTRPYRVCLASGPFSVYIVCPECL